MNSAEQKKIRDLLQDHASRFFAGDLSYIETGYTLPMTCYLMGKYQVHNDFQRVRAFFTQMRETFLALELGAFEMKVLEVEETSSGRVVSTSELVVNDPVGQELLRMKTKHYFVYDPGGEPKVEMLEAVHEDDPGPGLASRLH